jgi:thioredoxin-dependent peroxiredoxin
MPSMVEVGNPAPEFSATDCQGRPLKLSDFRGRKVVLFFFPKAFSSGCTAEVRHFRDNHEKIRALGAELLGVSVDKSDKQCEFAAKESLAFPLVGDESKEISKAYGVLWPLVRVDRRVTFIVGVGGVVESVIKHETKVYRHLDDVLAHLQAKG